MKKKILTFTLASVALSAAALAGCSLFGGGGDSAEKTVIQDNMRFTLKSDGTYELYAYEYAYIDDGYGNAYDGDGETVTVPDKVNGKAVTSVASYAFGNTGVKTVTLPRTVTELSERLFDGCVLLETVNMSAVTSIGYMAFYNCANLESIRFESGLTEIGGRAFQSCPSLTSITLPDTVTTIGDSCFWACPIDSINLTGVEVLGENAFYNCANLTSLNLPNIVSIGARAFGSCGNLSEITIGNRLEEIDSGFRELQALSKVSISSPVPAEAFQWCEGLTDLTLGEGVTSIGEMAFGYCKGIKNVTLPSTLAEIGKNAFWESGLTEITITSSVKTIDESAFYGCSSLVELTIENGVESIGKNAFNGTPITSLSLPASLKSLGDGAFCDCNSLTQITIAEGLQTIGASAFAIKGAQTLEIVLPSTVKSIGSGCFAYSYQSEKGITANKIIINDTVETIGENILAYCKVKELAAPVNYEHNTGNTLQTLTLFGEGNIPASAYNTCTELKTVTIIGGGVKVIGANAFKGLERINLDGVEYMGLNALGDLTNLVYTKTENGINYIDNWIISTDYSNGGATSIDLSGLTGVYHEAFRKTDANDTSALRTVALCSANGSSNLKCIGRYAFSGTNITAVEVPASLQNWDYAFRGCGLLSNVEISRGIEAIPNYAFAECNSLTGINLSSTDITEIGEGAFSTCTNLVNVTLPDCLKVIGRYAFERCSSIYQIDLKNVEEIGSMAFWSCSDIEVVTMNSVVSIGTSAFDATAVEDLELPATLTEIGTTALGSVTTVKYGGTREQWEALVGSTKVWRSASVTVEFSDGESHTYE